jgi:hypothetical protein
MPTTPNKSEAEPAPSKPTNAKPPEITSAFVPDTLASLKVNLGTGLTRAEVDTRRKGNNEVDEKKGHPVRPQVPWWQTLTVFGYAMVSCLVVNDVVKVAMIKWRVPAEVA